MKAKFIGCDNEWGLKMFHLEGIIFSQSFCEYFANNFEEIFVKETGIKPSTKVQLGGFKQRNATPMYQPGLVSKLNVVLWIMPYYYDDISFCWKSKTGKIIKITDETFDANDLECWIENLKPAEYWKQVATEKKSHPFQIANLPYKLKVYEFGVDMELRIYVNNTHSIETIKNVISTTIETYNDVSEAKNRENGVVHNHHFEEDKPYLCLRIDTGSAGINIIKKILKALATTCNEINKVEVDL